MKLSNLDYARETYTPGVFVENLFEHHIYWCILETDDFLEHMDGTIYLKRNRVKFYLYEGGVWADLVKIK
jgi:hypothetical protein